MKWVSAVVYFNNQAVVLSLLVIYRTLCFTSVKPVP